MNRRTHGFLDYIVGIALILAPKIFGFDNGGIEARLPVILGVSTIIYSLLTNYELGLFKVLPFKAHLGLDVMAGILLALSPWLFQFSERVWVPHLVVGLLEIGAVMMTRRSDSEVDHHHHLPGTPARM